MKSPSNNKINFSLVLAGIVLLGTMTSCKKYLDKKPLQRLAVPSNVKDLRAVLDNALANVGTPDLIEFPTDNFYIQSSFFNGMPEEMRKLYVWNANAIITVENSVWTNPYLVIYQANFVLDLLPKIAVGQNEESEAANIKGTALFYRAFMFHQLAQLFCKPYSSTAANDPGIVVKITPAVDEPIVRSTVKQTYDQIIADFSAAADLLSEKQQVNTRPNKAAAFGALARTSLSMRDYSNAELYANKSLASYSTLLDYNTLTPSASDLPSNPLNNPEILYLSGTSLSGVFSAGGSAIPDSILYQSYAANDLRKTVFFTNNGKSFHGSYDTYYTPSSIFDGIATDEVLLIRAESRIRNGNIAGGLDDLNTLLKKRWETNSFTDITASNQADALDKVLTERRKELAFRGTRWSDLRRFNLEGANITLKRILDNVTYTLPPNDPRWVLLIPDIEINRSGIQQNPR